MTLMKENRSILIALAAAAALTAVAAPGGGGEAPLGSLKPQARAALQAKIYVATGFFPSYTERKRVAAEPRRAETPDASRPWFYAIRTYHSAGYGPSFCRFKAGFSPEPESMYTLSGDANGFAGTLIAPDSFTYADWTVNSSGGITAVNWVKLNPADGNIQRQSLQVADPLSMDMTFDATSGKIYAISAMADVLTNIDPANGGVKVVAESLPFYTISCDQAGQLYGIAVDTEGNASLHSVNKATGASVKVGDTGVKVFTQNGYSIYQTAEFSPADGCLYWTTVTPEGNGALYRVDITDGHAAYLNVFPASEGFSAMAPLPLTANAGAPGAPTDIDAHGAADASLRTVISLKAPALTADGKTLESLESVAIYRGREAEALHTFIGPKPGEALSFTDENAASGFNAYRIVATNEAGSSVPVYASAFCGDDFPLAPQKLSVALSGDGVPRLTWTAPTKGVNGLDLRADKITYTVTRNLSGTEEEIVASGLQKCEYTDAGIPLDKQAYPYYRVRAVSPSGEGLPSAPAGIYTGPAYELPFAETFAGCVPSTAPWISQSLALGGAWELNYISTFPGTGPADDDGMLIFPCFSLAEGAEGRIASPLITFADAANPVLTFQFYYLNMESEDLIFDDGLQVEYSLDRGQTFEPVENGLYLQKNANTRWTEVSLPLKAVAGKPDVSIAFRGISDGGFNVLLDAIAIKDVPAGIVTAREEMSDTDAPIYTLDGRMLRSKSLSGLPAGIYIRAGRKIIIR